MAVGESNVHLFDLMINEEDESFTQTVSVTSGSGEVTRTPTVSTGQVSYGETTEVVSFSNKTFDIADSGYSGDVSIQYSAKKFFILKAFALSLSGLTQVNTFISKIVVKVSGTALGYSIKNALSAVRIKFVTTALSSVKKNIIHPVSIKFNLANHISAKRNIIAAVAFVGSLTRILTNRKNISSTVAVKCGGSAEITVARYTLISDYTGNTLEEMKDLTLNQIIYTSA